MPQPIYLKQRTVWDYILPYAGRYGLMKAEQNWRAKEAETERTWREGQVAEERQFRTGEAEKSRQFQKEQLESRLKPRTISYGGKDYLMAGYNILGPRYSAEYDEKGNFIQVDALTDKRKVLLKAPKPTGALKIGTAKELLIQKVMLNKPLTPAEKRAWNLLSGFEKAVAEGTIRMLSNDPEYLSETDPTERSKILRRTENTIRGLYGLDDEKTPLHQKINPQARTRWEQQLSGLKPGIYIDDDLGVSVEWDGTRVERVIEENRMKYRPNPIITP